MSGQKPREIAVQVLARRMGGEFVEDVLEQALARTRLSLPDRHLCQELTYGVVRWQATLDWLIARKTAGRAQQAALQNLLRLGLYQIFWLERIPNHAAVNETVELAKRSGFGPQAGFVNAVLRGYLREFDATRQVLAELKRTQPDLGYSHPEWLVARWERRWGAGPTAQLLEWNNVPPKTFARVNTLKADAGKLLTQWRGENVEYDFFRRDWLAEELVFELKSHPPLASLPSFQQGLFYIQDPSTLLAPRELDPQPGETVLDLCAAPGGKLTYLAQLMRNEGRLLAHEISSERLRLVAENCARLGVTCVQTVLPAGRTPNPMPSAEPKFQGSESKVQGSGFKVQGSRFRVQGYSPTPQFAPLPSSSVDKVLVDAPCSNTGVMRRRVDLRWRIRPEEIERLQATQLELLGHALTILRPGGRLVYSTCSLEPEENRELLEKVLRKVLHVRLERERELLPFTDGVDGAYVARLSVADQNKP